MHSSTCSRSAFAGSPLAWTRHRPRWPSRPPQRWRCVTSTASSRRSSPTPSTTPWWACGRATRLLTFEAPGLILELQVSRTGDRRALVGALAGGDDYRLRLGTPRDRSRSRRTPTGDSRWTASRRARCASSLTSPEGVRCARPGWSSSGLEALLPGGTGRWKRLRQCGRDARTSPFVTAGRRARRPRRSDGPSPGGARCLVRPPAEHPAPSA